MQLTTRTLVELEYVEGRGPAAKPQLTHKRLFGLPNWPDSANAQIVEACAVVAQLEGTSADRINLATIRTIGSVYVADET